METRTAKIGVIGLGYVGLPLSLLLSEAGFKVTGFDIDTKKVTDLEAGRSYIFRIPADGDSECAEAGLYGYDRLLGFVGPGRDHHVRAHSADGASRAGPELCREYGEGCCSVAAGGAAGGAREHDVSGDNRRADDSDSRRREQAGLKVQGAGTPAEKGVFYVAFSPEREDPGNTTVARHNIPKVVGGHEEIATELAAVLYEGIFTRSIRVSSTRVAEMTKLLENIYRCVNIALVNELKVLSLRMGVDIWEVIDAASTKPFGFHPFYPGPGLGGHCIPIDPFYLSWKAKEYDFNTRFIELAGEVNEAMPAHVVQYVAKGLNQNKKAVNGSRILMLGMAYKKDIDDLRESPSLTVIELLREQGAEVVYNDPYFPTVGRGRHYNLNMTCTPLENLGQYDCVLIMTDHSDYDYKAIVNQSQLVVDSRNATKGIKSEKIVRC